MHHISRTLKLWTGRLAFLVLTGLLMTACELGQQAPPEPINGDTISPQDTGPTQAGNDASGVNPQPGDPGLQLTETPLIQIPPTATTEAQLSPSEQIQSISIDGLDHRTQEAVSVRVRRGSAVGSMDCKWVHQDTGQSATLTAPASTQVDGTTFEDVFSFTPSAAGTYVVNCTGIATTVAGNRAVSLAGTPFSVEAKG